MNMEKIVMSDDSVLFDWLMITSTEEHKDVLLQIVKLWVTIRANSFAKHILEMYKRKQRNPLIKLKVLEHDFSLISCEHFYLKFHYTYSNKSVYKLNNIKY